MNKKVFALLCFFCAGLSGLNAKKPWTFMVYMAANNDLDIFAPRNLSQMKKVGSNGNINIVTHLYTRENKGRKRKTFFIKQKETILLKEIPNSSSDCGDKQNLIDFCVETIKKYPADHYALIMWNHGTGIIEPKTRSSLSSSQLFSFVNLNEFTRSQHFLPFIRSLEMKKEFLKGVCFDDSTGNFLTEKKLQSALQTITQTALGGEKIDLIGFDACLMSMIEVASSLKKYVSVMVGSQEVELGTGWNYARVLAPFIFGSISPKTLGTHIVNSYAKTYERVEDFTQSALDLNVSLELESNIQSLAQHLYNCATKKSKKQWQTVLRVSRNRHFCTHFDEPSFIDLHHFYENLLANVQECPRLKEENPTEVAHFQDLLRSGMQLIKKMVIANKTGPKLPFAKGVSIYFPEHSIHSSYRKSSFALANNAWMQLISFYVSC